MKTYKYNLCKVGLYETLQIEFGVVDAHLWREISNMLKWNAIGELGFLDDSVYFNNKMIKTK